MNPIERFARYAAAFEVAFEKDDWTGLEPFFTEDAVYETIAAPPLGGRTEGRQAVFDFLRRSLDHFDRRFDSRALELLEGPELRDGAVWIRWKAIYRVDGAPPLELPGEETAHFEGERIRRLEDRIPEEASRAVQTWLQEHGHRLRDAPA